MQKYVVDIYVDDIYVKTVLAYGHDPEEAENNVRDTTLLEFSVDEL